MIIECHACHAKFRLDEGKIRGRGAKVKCRKCGDTIIVMKPEGGAPAPLPPVAPASGSFDLARALEEGLDLPAPPPSQGAAAPAAFDLTRAPLGPAAAELPQPSPAPPPAAQGAPPSLPPEGEPPAGAGAEAVDGGAPAEGDDEGPPPAAFEGAGAEGGEAPAPSWVEQTAVAPAGAGEPVPGEAGGGEPSWFEQTAVAPPDGGSAFSEEGVAGSSDEGSDEGTAHPGDPSWFEQTAVAPPEPPRDGEGADEGPSPGMEEGSWFEETTLGAPAAAAPPAGAGQPPGGVDPFGTLGEEPLDLAGGAAAAPHAPAAPPLPPFGEPFAPFGSAAVPLAAAGPDAPPVSPSSPASPGPAGDPFAASWDAPSRGGAQEAAPPEDPFAAAAGAGAATEPAAPSAPPSDTELDDFFLDLAPEEKVGEAPSAPVPPPPAPASATPARSAAAGKEPPEPGLELPDFLASTHVGSAAEGAGEPSSPAGVRPDGGARSRRGGGAPGGARSVGPAALPAAVMALLLAAAGGWLAFTGSGRGVLRTVLPRIASHWNGGPAAARGGLELRNLSLAPLSGVSGEMVVLRGEVVNGGRATRSRLQVEATLLDERGRERGKKRVYAGNTPTDEELGAATAEEIDRRLANPLGDGLRNADVPAGRSVPFVAVFPGIAPGSYTSSVKAVEGK